MDASYIRALATGLRDHLMQLPTADREFYFTEFPRGSCGDAALLMHSLLCDAGITGSHVVYGTCQVPEQQEEITHNWVALNDLVIDITADQFDCSLPAVYVGLSAQLHSAFQISKTSCARVQDQCPYGTVPFLVGIYERIRDRLITVRLESEPKN